MNPFGSLLQQPLHYICIELLLYIYDLNLDYGYNEHDDNGEVGDIWEDPPFMVDESSDLAPFMIRIAPGHDLVLSLIGFTQRHDIGLDILFA